MPPPKMVFRVEYRDERCKIDAINALNAIQGVEAKNDDRAGFLLRDVTVTVTGGAYPEIPGKILNIFASVQNKFVPFKVTFKYYKHQKDALRVVNALKGVGKVEFGGNVTEHASNTPLTLKVFGDPDPEIVLNILQTYGTARFH